MSTVKKQFMFVHIPKTAGTTFVLTLARHFRWQKKLPMYFHVPLKDHPKFSSEYRNRFDLCYGHVAFDSNLSIERGIEYFTFLRNPRERLLSGYKHIKGDGEHGIKKKINVADYLLKDFLKQGNLKNFDNLMVRYLSGNIAKDYLQINKDDLDLAIKNFDKHFHAFGLTEYFNESLVLLADYMQWSPLYYVRENNSSYTIDSKELDEETEKLILTCNQYDEVLYKHAKDRFLQQLEVKKEIVKKGLTELLEGNEQKKSSLAFRNKIGLAISALKLKLR